jgi:type I restriction enzyme S subunit
LDNIELEVWDRVKFISENEECESLTIKEICDISKGSGVVKEQRTGGQFPYYASNGHISGSYMNKYNKEGTFILLAEDGTIGSKHYIKNGKKIYVGDHVHILKTKNISCYFIYLSLNLVNFDIYTTGSVIPKLNKRNLEKIKLSIPKNKKLITELEPKFAQIEQLKLDIQDAETRFEQYIEELGNEAIKK